MFLKYLKSSVRWVFKKEKYDLILSIGEACSCTQALRKSNLQIFSYPFDWLFGASFETEVLSESIKILTADYKMLDEKIDYAFNQDKLKNILKNIN